MAGGSTTGPGAVFDPGGTPPEPPGAVRVQPGELEINADRGPAERGELTFTNTADRPIQIGSHVHLAQVNAGLQFDRAAAEGFRLDIPAGTSLRFEPGVSRMAGIVALKGGRSVPGIQIRSDHSETR
jgi:urease subunit beta